MLIELVVMDYISFKLQKLSDTKQYWIAEESAFHIVWIISIMGIQECRKIISNNSNLVVTQSCLESGCSLMQINYMSNGKGF